MWTLRLTETKKSNLCLVGFFFVYARLWYPCTWKNMTHTTLEALPQLTRSRVSMSTRPPPERFATLAFTRYKKKKTKQKKIILCIKRILASEFFSWFSKRREKLDFRVLIHWFCTTLKTQNKVQNPFSTKLNRWFIIYRILRWFCSLTYTFIAQ